MSDERRRVEWSLDLANMRVRAGQFVTETMGQPAEAREAVLHEPLAGAESGRARLTFAAGRASVRALAAGSPNLFEARLRYVGELDYGVSGGAQRQIKLRSKPDLPNQAASAVSKAQDLRWDLALAPSVPLQLDLRAGLGEAELDLSQLAVEALRLNTGVGKVALTLPAAKRIDAEVYGGVGATMLTIPAGACGRLKIKGGVGQMLIQAAAGSAIQLRGKTGLAPLDLPDSLVRIGGKRAKQIWQTAAYEAAKAQIRVEYVGGVGGLALDFSNGQ